MISCWKPLRNSALGAVVLLAAGLSAEAAQRNNNAIPLGKPVPRFNTQPQAIPQRAAPAPVQTQRFAAPQTQSNVQRPSQPAYGPGYGAGIANPSPMQRPSNQPLYGSGYGAGAGNPYPTPRPSNQPILGPGYGASIANPSPTPPPSNAPIYGTGYGAGAGFGQPYRR